MARPLRVEYPGAFYHVFSKGGEGEAVFKNKMDKEKFLEYLAKDVGLFSVVIHTYCIMANHYHLLIETPHANLSVAIQWLNISYATYYNTKYQRNGKLFQGRFKSILMDKDGYIKEFSRYIHLNPVRSKITKRPIAYPWSSYSSFSEKNEERDWLETDGLLAYFSKKRKQAVLKYKNFVEGFDAKSLENPGKGLVGGFILGDEEFVKNIYKKYLSKKRDKNEISQHKRLKPRMPVDKIVKAVCVEFGCKKGHIQQKGLKRNEARDLSIYLAREISGVSCNALGEYFGGISGAAITARYKSVSAGLGQNKKAKDIVGKIKANI